MRTCYWGSTRFDEWTFQAQRSNHVVQPPVPRCRPNPHRVDVRPASKGIRRVRQGSQLCIGSFGGTDSAMARSRRSYPRLQAANTHGRCSNSGSRGGPRFRGHGAMATGPHAQSVPRAIPRKLRTSPPLTEPTEASKSPASRGLCFQCNRGRRGAGR